MASVPTTTHPGGSNPQIAGSKNSQQVEQFVNSQLAKAASYVKVVDLFGSLMNLMWATLIGFLILAIVDAWIFELPMWLRSLAFLTLAGAAIAWLAKYTVPLLIYRVSPAYAARSIEKRRPELKNSLINYLSMRGETRFSNTNVFQLIGLRAATDLNEVPTDDAADTRKLIRIGIVLGAVLFVCVLYKFLSPIDPFQTVGRVLQPLADISRPSRITISEVTPGDHRLYFGEPLEVSARVKGDLNGQDVILVYKTLDGQESTRTIAMTESSNGIFSTILSTGNAGIQTSLSYWIVAGDGQSPEYRVDVRPVPTIVVEQIDYTYPEYTRQPKLQSKTNAKISGIEGTIVQLKAKSNVQLSTAIVEFLINVAPDQNAAADYQVVDTESLSIDLNELAGDFRLRLDNDRKAAKYTHYRFSYAAAEDGRNRKSDIYPVHVIADLAPEISVTDPTSIENTVPLNRVLDFNVEAIDPDFEISKIQAVLVGPVHNRDSRVNLNLQQKSGFAQVTGQYQLNPKALRLEVGSEISIDFRAFDNRQSAASNAIDPNITKSTTYKIRVTEPEYSSDSNESAASKTDSKNQQPDNKQDSNDKSNDSNSVNNKSEQSSQNSNDRKSDENQSVDNKDQNQADKTDSSNANTDQNDSNQKNNDQNSKNKNDSTQMNKDSNPNESHQSQENKNQPPNQNDKKSGDQNKNDAKNSNQENKQDKRSDNSSQNSDQNNPDQKNSDSKNSDQKNSDQKNSDNRSKDDQQQSKQNSSQQDQSNRDSSQNNKNDGNNQQNQGSQTDQNKSQNSSSQSGANNSEKSATQNGSQDPSKSNQRSADGSNNQKNSDQSATNNSQTNQGSENSNDPRPGNPSGTNDRPLDHEGDRFEKLLEKYKDEIKRLKDQENQSRQNENNNDQSSKRSDQSDENNSNNPEANTDQNNEDKEDSADSRQGNAKDKQNPNENAAENSSNSKAESDPNLENKNAHSSKNESNKDQKGQPKDGMNNKLDGSDENGGQPDKHSDENQTNKVSNESAASDQESKKNNGSNQNKDQSAKSENGADQKINQNNSSNDNSLNNQDKSADNKSSNKTDSNESGADRAADPNRKKDASETDQNNNGSKQNDSTAAQSSDNKNESGDANDSNRKNSTKDQNSDQPGNQSNQQNADKKSDDSNKNAQSNDSNSKQNSKTDPRANQSDDNKNDLKKSGNSKDSNNTQSSNEANSQRKDQSDAKNARAKQNNEGNMDPAAPRHDGKTGRKDDRKRTSTPNESEKANIEYAKNATDLVLKYLEDQQDKDNDELLNEMNWTREEMSEFIKRWREMKNAADQGGSSEKREFNDALKSLGLRPPSNEVSNANIKNDNQRNMKEDGAISKPPADLVKKFRAFQRGRSRSESNR